MDAFDQNLTRPGKRLMMGLRPSRLWRFLGHRSMDLAMTTLFGGFDRAFYEAYDWHYPLPPDHRRQWAVCNLYPLLVHLNLFGEAYMTNILHTIQDF